MHTLVHVYVDHVTLYGRFMQLINVLLNAQFCAFIQSVSLVHLMLTYLLIHAIFYVASGDEEVCSQLVAGADGGETSCI